MGPVGVTTNVLETLETLQETEFLTVFVNKVITIFEHSKDEIVDLLMTKSVPVLKKLRDMIFAELVLKLPRFAGREMYSRRKEELWAEDIYVFAFSAVSGLPDKRLDKCLKPMLD